MTAITGKKTVPIESRCITFAADGVTCEGLLVRHKDERKNNLIKFS